MDRGSHGNDDGVGDDEESAPALGRRAGGGIGGIGGGARGGRRGGAASSNKWGSRGISISADDATLEHEQLFAAERSDGHHNLDASVDPDAHMHDPDDLARALVEDEDNDALDIGDDDDDDDGAPPPPASNGKKTAGANEPSGVRNDEWND